MTEFRGKQLSPALIRKAAACKSVEDLLALAKDNGIEATPEEAQAYLEEISSRELTPEDMAKVAGGKRYIEEHPEMPMPDESQD